ncbi:TniQ family protein [Paracoccus sp. p4-l81]|uniref:TniQ family protein n=1 Tax=Paracoccus sp. p4-l81 TaxID=3342806 RepID=UPI0035B769DD
MTRLALTLPVSPLETPTSYLSRLSARNLSPDLHSFCADLGFDLPALVNGDMAAVYHLCSLAGLPKDTFDARVVIKTSTMKYRLGVEALNTETLSRGEIRYCPRCLSEALGQGPAWSVVFPLHWQLMHVRRCCQHGCRLETHRPEPRRASRFDCTAFLRTWTGSEGTDAAVPSHADELDGHLSARAYGQHASNWCDRLEIPALIKASEAFGVLTDHGRDMRASYLTADQRRDAMLTGFLILSAGQDGIRGALDRFNSRTPSRGGNQPHPSNGEVQRLLGSHCKMRADLDPVRDIVREYFLDNYPFRPGTTVLGQKVTESRVFSMRGACREIGVRGSLLEEMLIRRGYARRDDAGGFQLETALTRSLVAEIKHEKDDYLNQQQTADFLGCSFAMFKQLQREGLLHPAEGDRLRQRKGFHRPDLQAFLDRLADGALRTGRAGGDICTIDLATRKANCSVPDIVQLMLDGQLRAVGRLSDEIRLDSLLISAGRAARLLQLGPPNGLSKSEAQRRLCVDSKTLDWLLEQGHLTAKRTRHSITRVTRDYVTIGSVTQFEAEYGTAGVIARQLGLASHFVGRRLRTAGHLPLEAPGGTRPIYRRRDIVAIIEALKNSEDRRT